MPFSVEKIEVEFKHPVDVPVMVGFGSGLTVTVFKAGVVAVHPLIPVYETLTNWVPGVFHETRIEFVVAPEVMEPPADMVHT